MVKTPFYKGFCIIALIIMAIIFSTESFGQPPPSRRPPAKPRPPARPVIRQPSPPALGKVIVSLPLGFLRIVIGGAPFFYHSGIFYQKVEGGYVVVQAPYGAIVTTIPVGFVTFVSGGITYYFYSGVYYRKVPEGYKVVEAPPDAVIAYESSDKEEASSPAPSATIDERVSVTAQRLNVRSGPGKEHPVITYVDQGSVLIIKGTAQGWYYVQLPNGKYGWVDQVYTRPYSPPASG